MVNTRTIAFDNTDKPVFPHPMLELLDLLVYSATAPGLHLLTPYNTWRD